ncbi:MAG: hypothetical protein ACREYE_02235, partial [Gammaproteobacteria bacterium]
HVRVYPPVSLRLPSAVLPALLKRQLTISRTSAEFMQAYRKDTLFYPVHLIQQAQFGQEAIFDPVEICPIQRCVQASAWAAFLSNMPSYACSS